MKKIQKKYYLTKETSDLLKLASFCSGISQSRIVEACIILELVKMSLKKKGKK